MQLHCFCDGAGSQPTSESSNHQPDNPNDEDAETTKTMMLFSVVLASLSHNNALRRFPAPKEFPFWWFYFGDDCSESQMVCLIIKQPVH